MNYNVEAVFDLMLMQIFKSEKRTWEKKIVEKKSIIAENQENLKSNTEACCCIF
jgi:hypothetical protein